MYVGETVTGLVYTSAEFICYSYCSIRVFMQFDDIVSTL